ncbi:hypothetical protein [Cohnella sp.]|uniref:hypothetical protein n=1 Tax=Cohnella sp. TaxID=1883426 RepID=UPI00356B064E
MKGAIAAVSLLVMIAIMTSCTSRESSTPVEEAVGGTDKAVSTPSCQDPPKTFMWDKKTYTLKTIGERDLEPGMKLGYLACDKGTYTQRAKGDNATFNIYTLRSPLESSDLIYFGKWNARYIQGGYNVLFILDFSFDYRRIPTVQKPRSSRGIVGIKAFGILFSRVI